MTKPRRPASGRFLLRLPPGLHAALREAARTHGVSLNEHCARQLAAPPSFVLDGAAEAVRRAAELFGADLIGIVAFGSWARGEAVDGSDVDLLVVVEPRVRLERALYRRWDEAPVRFCARDVDPHFAHLPAPDETVAGVWGEVALDGIVLFERGLVVSRRMVAVRHDVVAGRIVRRFAHGQPYWALNEVA